MIKEKFSRIKIILFTAITINFMFTVLSVSAQNDAVANIVIKDGILHINSFDRGRYESTCHVQVLIEYNVMVENRYKSDSTAYNINILTGKYYKYGGFEYNENEKPMHYESQHSLSHRDNLIERPDSWPSVQGDNVAKEIYNYLKINNVLCN